jgi:FKBP-type peptidyl-prolyl cis-trans isomerase
MIKKLAIFAFIVLLAPACKGGGRVETSSSPDVLGGDNSYAFGMILGSDFSQTGLQFDYDAFVQGFKDSIEGKNTRFSFEEAMTKVQAAYGDAVSRKNEEYRQAEMLFLADNRKKAGIIVTGTGLQYEVINEGTGPHPRAEDTVQVHYKGTLVDGTEFDSSYSRGEPAEFPLNQVIPGWTEGIQLMSVGSTYRFYVPSDLAYGENGASNVIPPYSALIFEVELLSVIE